MKSLPLNLIWDSRVKLLCTSSREINKNEKLVNYIDALLEYVFMYRKDNSFFSKSVCYRLNLLRVAAINTQILKLSHKEKLIVKFINSIDIGGL